MKEHETYLTARTATLTASDEPFRFGGVAVAAGDVLTMEDGRRVLMTAEELQAAETVDKTKLKGEPLTKDHPRHEDGSAKYPPEVDDTFGKVEKSGWIEDEEAVAYEVVTHDRDIATGVSAGSLDVSVHPFFNVEPYDGSEADVIATDIIFGDLSVVAKGDSPSATAEAGTYQALAEWTNEQDFDSLDESSPESIGRRIANGLVQSLRGENMTDNNKERETLVAETNLTEDQVEAMEEDVVHETYNLVNAEEPSADDEKDEEEEQTLADLTVDDLATELEKVGFVTEDSIEAQEKGEKVDELIASSDRWDEDDREELMASSEALIDREHERISRPKSQLPAAGGLTASAPNIGDDDEADLEAYGTGVMD